MFHTAASFSNSKESTSQLGLVIIIADKNGNVNIIDYLSIRCRKVTRGVMAAELHALILGFDLAYINREMMMEILGRGIPIEAYVDSRTVFDDITKDVRTTGRRLRIDVAAFNESCIRGYLAE